MAFVLAKVFWFVAEPGHLIFIAFAVAGVLWFLRWRHAAARLAAAAAGAYCAIVFLPLGTWLLLPLEGRFPPPSPPPARIDGVVVLGGSIEPRLSAGRNQTQLNESGERLLALVELARLYPDARLVFTGGSGRLIDPDLREADHAERLMERVGLARGRVIYERDSRDTAENASMTKALVQPRANETWLLVTSAWHMPRSVGAFRRAGWTVVPWPVDYASSGDDAWRIGPAGLEGMRRFTLATREWIGLIAYRAMGRTDALFPGP